MNPALIELLVTRNGADIEAIIAKIGVGTLLSLLPHILNIVKTLQQEGTAK